MKRSEHLHIKLDIRLQDIHDALDKAALPKTTANVLEVKNFVRCIAIDAASTALIDWIQQHQQER